jgi:hypothetical protein
MHCLTKLQVKSLRSISSGKIPTIGTRHYVWLKAIGETISLNNRSQNISNADRKVLKEAYQLKVSEGTVKLPRCLSSRHSSLWHEISRYIVKSQVDTTPPNVAATWIAFLHRIWEVPGSNLGRGFPQSLHADAEIVHQIKSRTLPSVSFPIHYSSISLSFDVIGYKLLTASLHE